MLSVCYAVGKGDSSFTCNNNRVLEFHGHCIWDTCREMKESHYSEPENI